MAENLNARFGSTTNLPNTIIFWHLLGKSNVNYVSLDLWRLGSAGLNPIENRFNVNLHGREPWSSGYGRRLTYRRSWVRIPVPYTGWTWYFFTLICCKNCIVCLKRPKINEKEAGIGPFFLKKTYVTLGGGCGLVRRAVASDNNERSTDIIFSLILLGRYVHPETILYLNFSFHSQSLLTLSTIYISYFSFIALSLSLYSILVLSHSLYIFLSLSLFVSISLYLSSLY